MTVYAYERGTVVHRSLDGAPACGVGVGDNPGEFRAVPEDSLPPCSNCWRDAEALAPVVYFALTQHGTIKIGSTTNLERRLIQLAYSWQCRGKVELLATTPGRYDLERAVHKVFRDERIGRSEEFEPSPRLMAYIDSLRASDSLREQEVAA